MEVKEINAQLSQLPQAAARSTQNQRACANLFFAMSYGGEKSLSLIAGRPKLFALFWGVFRLSARAWACTVH